MKKLYDKTWTEADGGVRFFLLTGNDKALVIDTGMTGVDILAAVSQHTDLPCILLNTHADRDHIGGNSQFEEIYMHPSEYPFYRHQKSDGELIPVFDGDIIDLGGRELEIIHLPGHTPGSITVLDRANRCLIGGDPVQKNGNIYMFGPHRSLEAYIVSLERLQTRDDFDYIYPSHADEKVGREVIPKLIEGARAFLDGMISGEERDIRGNKIIACDVGVDVLLCDAK